jgi:hypothetical protein
MNPISRSFLFISICALVIPWAAESSARDEPLLKRGDVVAFVGGEEMVELQRTGYLESLLAPRLDGVRYRCLAFEGDTVYEQPRELNFGSWSNQLKRAAATVVVAAFGQAESLDGAARLPEFIENYKGLLRDWGQGTRQIILIAPHPFEQPKPPLPDLSSRNRDLARYVEAIRDLAQSGHCHLIDLFAPFQEGSRGFTRDGMHLNSAGHWLAAREIVRQLGFPPPAAGLQVDPVTGRFTSSRWEELRDLVRRKNEDWFNYWRPMNWAFLHGDRTEQQSSRDHRDPGIRWFPREMERFVPLIQARETEIESRAVQLNGDVRSDE